MDVLVLFTENRWWPGDPCAPAALKKRRVAGEAGAHARSIRWRCIAAVKSGVMPGAFLAVAPSLTHAAAGFQAAPVSAGAGFRVSEACRHPSKKEVVAPHPKLTKPAKPQHAMPHDLRASQGGASESTDKPLIQKCYGFLRDTRPDEE
ncbi:MAG: hypothetical protein ACYCWB_00345 [Thiobacillus sp.]